MNKLGKKEHEIYDFVCFQRINNVSIYGDFIIFSMKLCDRRVSSFQDKSNRLFTHATTYCERNEKKVKLNNIAMSIIFFWLGIIFF